MTRFSSFEIRELTKAWLAVSLAFAILYSGTDFFSTSFLFLFGTCILIVGSGFLLHELAHKFVAQRFGCWAEFHADNKMLLFMLAASFFGIILAAPGGVFIHGNLTRQKHGKISLAGPFMNLLFALGFFLLLLHISFPLFSFGFSINAWLAFFNLLPFLPFDGKKVFDWHKGVYFSVLSFSLLLLAFTFVIL